MWWNFVSNIVWSLCSVCRYFTLRFWVSLFHVRLWNRLTRLYAKHLTVDEFCLIILYTHYEILHTCYFPTRSVAFRRRLRTVAYYGPFAFAPSLLFSLPTRRHPIRSYITRINQSGVTLQLVDVIRSPRTGFEPLKFYSYTEWEWEFQVLFQVSHIHED